MRSFKVRAAAPLAGWKLSDDNTYGRRLTFGAGTMTVDAASAGMSSDSGD